MSRGNREGFIMHEKINGYWRIFYIFQLTIGIPFFLVLLYLIKLPESVRWAWAVGKIDTANRIIAKMSEVNNVEIPEEFLLKQKPKLLPKSEAGMGSLIASNELRGNYSISVFHI